MKLKKISFKMGLLLTLVGICIATFGYINGYQPSRFAGFIICAGGMTSMGKRLYERIQEKAIERKKARGEL